MKINYKINFDFYGNVAQLRKILASNSKLNFVDYTINEYIKDIDLNIIVKIKDEKFFFITDLKEYSDLNELITEEHIFPQLFSVNLDETSYIDNLVKLEHDRDFKRHKLFSKYNEIFNQNFEVINGINSIYEWYTGAVFFKDYEWEEIDTKNKLKNLFKSKIGDSFIYSLPLDSGIILRGPDIYYYFSTDVSRFKKPILKQIKKWFDNVNIFLDKALVALDGYNISNEYDKRLLLGLIDNLRNIILLLANCELMFLSNQGKDFIYNWILGDYPEIDAYFNLIELYQTCIEEVCINNNTNLLVSSIKTILENIKKNNKKTFKKVSGIKDDFILSKCFNPLREIDNYFENYIVSKYFVNNNKLMDREINIISILYGSLELPFIIRRLTNYSCNISFLFQNHGMYLDRQNKRRNYLDIEIVEYGFSSKKLPTYIVDDNMMSGVTMQFAYNKLVICNYENINGVFVVRHPNLNRYHQLKHFDVAVNLHLIDKFIFGMITDTPYSKIKERTNYNNMFVNELNIFSIMTEVFLKALYCNNRFIKDSQVDIFRGYSEGKND